MRYNTCMDLTCKNPKCGVVFEQVRKTHAFCSRRCRWMHNNAIDAARIAADPAKQATRLEVEQRYRERNSEKIKASSIARRLAMPEHRREADRLAEAKRRQAIRQRVIAHLGGKCAICGFRDPRALQVDHVNGGGTRHRKTVSTHRVWKVALISDPGVYQLLCASCNQIKRHEQGEGVRYNLMEP
jgi:5-methylcytosine-specific restriction endonuclease McrA